MSFWPLALMVALDLLTMEEAEAIWAKIGPMQVETSRAQQVVAIHEALASFRSTRESR